VLTSPGNGTILSIITNSLIGKGTPGSFAGLDDAAATAAVMLRLPQAEAKVSNSGRDGDGLITSVWLAWRNCSRSSGWSSRAWASRAWTLVS
jgi:hypothetical protein